jgi:hypothetical protein
MPGQGKVLILTVDSAPPEKKEAFIKEEPQAEWQPQPTRNIALWGPEQVPSLVGEMGIKTAEPLAEWLASGNKLDYSEYPPSQEQREAFRAVLTGMGYSADEALGFERGCVRILYTNAEDKAIALGEDPCDLEYVEDIWSD